MDEWNAALYSLFEVWGPPHLLLPSLVHVQAASVTHLPGEGNLSQVWKWRLKRTKKLKGGDKFVDELWGFQVVINDES